MMVASREYTARRTVPHQFAVRGELHLHPDTVFHGWPSIAELREYLHGVDLPQFIWDGTTFS